MILTDLFELQGGLMENIDYKGEDKADKMFLATIVELGEFAQEWRGFKYWSKNQEPQRRRVKPCLFCEGVGEKEEIDIDSKVSYHHCDKCDGTGEGLVYDPLLEEYVDVLHFILEWGITIDTKPNKIHGNTFDYGGSTTENINEVIALLTEMYSNLKIRENHIASSRYRTALGLFLHIGNSIGITDEQIRTAYIDKNNVNHTRQNTGY